MFEQRGPQLDVGLGNGGLLLRGEEWCELVRVGLGRPGELGAVVGELVAEQLCGASGLCFGAGLQLVPVLLQEHCNARAVLGVELLEALGFLFGARRGRTLQITAEMLIQSSCGIGRPLAPESLRAYLAAGEDTKLRRRLEADVKSLHALHEYGRLHHMVRLRWGFLDERLPAPWVHRDEPYLGELMKQALAVGSKLEVVIGTAPGWADPWARAVLARVVQGERPWERFLVDDTGMHVRNEEVQLARLATTLH